MFMRLETITVDGHICLCHRLQKVVITEAGDIFAVVHSHSDEVSKTPVFSNAYQMPAEAFPDGVINETTATLYLVSQGNFSGATLGAN